MNQVSDYIANLITSDPQQVEKIKASLSNLQDGFWEYAPSWIQLPLKFGVWGFVVLVVGLWLKYIITKYSTSCFLPKKNAFDFRKVLIYLPTFLLNGLCCL